MQVYVSAIPKLTLREVPIPEHYEGSLRFHEDNSLIWGSIERKSANDTQQRFLYGCYFNDNFATNRFICATVPQDASFQHSDLSSLFYHPVSDSAEYYMLETKRNMHESGFPLPVWGFRIPEKDRFTRCRRMLNTYFSTRQTNQNPPSSPSPESIAADFLLRFRDLGDEFEPITLEEKLS